MKYIIVGAGSGMPNTRQHNAGLLVQTSEYNLLLDCGEGTSAQLLRHGMSGDALDAVLISHYHPDHVCGIFMLIQMLYLEGRKKPLMVFVPERANQIRDMLHTFYTFEQRFGFALKLYEVREAELYLSDVVPVLNDHLRGYEELISKHKYLNEMKAYSFSITDREKTLLYTSDIDTFYNLKPALLAANHIIVDALHPAPELIISLLDYPAEKIILNHGISAGLSSWLKEHDEPRFSLSVEDVPTIL